MREAYSEHFQTSKMELFAKIVNSWKPLTIRYRILNTPLKYYEKGFLEDLQSSMETFWTSYNRSGNE